MQNRKRKITNCVSSDEIISGFNSVFEAIKAGRRKIGFFYIARDMAGEKLEMFLRENRLPKIPVHRISGDQMTALVKHDAHQGIAASVSAYPLADFEDVLESLHNKKAPLYLLLDSIEDPHNFGALCRTALAAGVDAVIIPKDRAAGPTPAVSRASAGALEHVRVVAVTNLVNSIKILKDAGVWISGLDGKGDRNIFETDFKGASGIVVGGEDSGIRELVRKNCDFLVSIPQAGPVNSLNASVAGAVAMYEAVRQRMETHRAD